MFIVLACFVFAVGLAQAVRPQLLWRMGRPLQRGWVRDPAGTEPTRRGYAMQRVVGIAFIVFAVWMVVAHL
jgi:hypothetical protein